MYPLKKSWVIHDESEEKEAICQLWDVISDYDILVTYAGNNYDLRVLKRRMSALGIRDPPQRIKTVRGRLTFTRTMHFDMFGWFNNSSVKNYAFGGKYYISSLDNVSQALLGEGKLEQPDFTKIDDTLAEYCMKDAELTYRLLHETGSYDLIFLLSRISRTYPEDLMNNTIATWIKFFYLWFFRRWGYIIPCKKELEGIEPESEAIIKGKKYKGAIVLEPVSGFWRNVIVVDFSSLYPSIMSRYNIGIDTINCNHKECMNNKVVGLSHHICTKDRSKISEIIEHLLRLRLEKYKPLAKTNPFFKEVSQSLKVFMNAQYGVFAYEGFDLYYAPVAESVTAIGRELILKSKKIAEELGYNYHVGITVTSDSFYSGQGRPSYGNYFFSKYKNIVDDLQKMNVLNFEMEASTLFTLASMTAWSE